MSTSRTVRKVTETTTVENGEVKKTRKVEESGNSPSEETNRDTKESPTPDGK